MRLLRKPVPLADGSEMVDLLLGPARGPPRLTYDSPNEWESDEEQGEGPELFMLRRGIRESVATRVLYMEERMGQEPDPCYLREFDAGVIERGPDFVVLDQTLFYAEGGGQPYDTGELRWSGGTAKVLRVLKGKGVIRHHVDRLPAADEVHGILDWDRRYKHMRMHTSQHLMSGLAFRIFGARTVGNQIHTDYSRVDLQPANFTPEDLKRIEDECNRVAEAAQEVRIFEEDRVIVHNKVEDRSLLGLIPASIKRLRVIQVGDADYCPCGGTHLRNTSEIGRVHILEKRSKGKETDRIVYELLPP